MTIISQSALNEVFELIDDETIPLNIRNAIRAKLEELGPRGLQLQTLVATARNAGLPNSQRRAAVETMIEVAKGELP